jgi:hypothetical protein
MYMSCPRLVSVSVPVPGHGWVLRCSAPLARTATREISTAEAPLHRWALDAGPLAGCNKGGGGARAELVLLASVGLCWSRLARPGSGPVR